MKYFLLAAALVTASAPAQAVQLMGTFRGVVTSGENSYGTNGVFTREDLTGGSGSIFINEDDNEGIFEGDIAVGPVTGGAGGAFGFSSTNVQYANGVLRMDIAVQSNFANSGAIARLTADLVDNRLVNWRGRIEAGGQITSEDSWGLFANFDRLTFAGIYAGPVPEPANWTLMIAGFGLVGAGVRHRCRTFTKCRPSVDS